MVRIDRIVVGLFIFFYHIVSIHVHVCINRNQFIKLNKKYFRMYMKYSPSLSIQNKSYQFQKQFSFQLITLNLSTINLKHFNNTSNIIPIKCEIALIQLLLLLFILVFINVLCCPRDQFTVAARIQPNLIQLAQHSLSINYTIILKLCIVVSVD